MVRSKMTVTTWDEFVAQMTVFLAHGAEIEMSSIERLNGAVHYKVVYLEEKRAVIAGALRVLVRPHED